METLLMYCIGKVKRKCWIWNFFWQVTSHPSPDWDGWRPAASNAILLFVDTFEPLFSCPSSLYIPSHLLNVLLEGVMASEDVMELEEVMESEKLGIWRLPDPTKTIQNQQTNHNQTNPTKTNHAVIQSIYIYHTPIAPRCYLRIWRFIFINAGVAKIEWF